MATAPSAAAAANVGGVDVVSVAQFSSCEGRVYLEATPLETLDGAYDVYFRADVYDYGSGAWVSSDWYLADGITNITFTVSNPYRVAYVQYARAVGDGWQISNEQITVTDPLDNMWCA